MSATFSRIKTWLGLETVQNTDLNKEFDNILNNLGLNGMTGWSSSVAQMKIQTSPGSVGSESLATTSNGEIERIRYQLNQIIGDSSGFWYASPLTNLSTTASFLAISGQARNRIVSGRVRTTSAQSQFLVPAGTSNGPSVTLKCSVTPMIVFIDGTQHTFSSDITLTNLALAPSSNNTALVNDVTLTGTAATKLQGEQDSILTIDTVGSNISGLVGNYAAFKIVDGANTEYFVANVTSSTTLAKANRGFFFDSSDSPIQRVVVNDDDTITLMKLAWIFLKSDGTLKVSYTNPRYDGNQPTSPSIGDYWFDLLNQTWKTFDGSSWNAASSVLVGVCATNTVDCVIARSFEFAENFQNVNSISVENVDSNTMRSKTNNPEVNVNGSELSFAHDSARWVKPTNIESGRSLSASGTAYLYITETGKSIISDIAPYKRTFDLRGWYHPFNTWRCVCQTTLDGSTNFQSSSSLIRDLAAVDVDDSTIQNTSGQLLIKDAGITSAKLATSAVATANIAANAVTRPKLVAVGDISSANVASLVKTYNAGSYENITNGATITTTGRPVVCLLTAPQGGSGMICQVTGAAGSQGLVVAVSRSGTQILTYEVGGSSAFALNQYIQLPTFFGLDDVPAGTYTYTIQAQLLNNNSTTVTFNNVVCLVYEL